MKYVYHFLLISICYFTLSLVLPNSCCGQVFKIDKDLYSVNRDTLRFQEMRHLFTTPEQLTFYDDSIDSAKSAKGWGWASLVAWGVGGATLATNNGFNPLGAILVVFVGPITSLVALIAASAGQTKQKKAVILLNESFQNLEPQKKLSLELVPSSYGAGLGLRLRF